MYSDLWSVAVKVLYRVEGNPSKQNILNQKNLSPNSLLMYTANVKDSENADRWLAALSSSIVH